MNHRKYRQEIETAEYNLAKAIRIGAPKSFIRGFENFIKRRKDAITTAKILEALSPADRPLLQSALDIARAENSNR